MIWYIVVLTQHVYLFDIHIISPSHKCNNHNTPVSYAVVLFAKSTFVPFRTVIMFPSALETCCSSVLICRMLDIMSWTNVLFRCCSIYVFHSNRSFRVNIFSVYRLDFNAMCHTFGQHQFVLISWQHVLTRHI